MNIEHLEPWHGVQAYMVLAMAQQSLNQNENAEATLNKGLDLAKMNATKVKARDFGLAWSDYMIAQALMREAKGVVQKHDAGQ